jgi:hypothetical protein
MHVRARSVVFVVALLGCANADNAPAAVDAATPKDSSVDSAESSVDTGAGETPPEDDIGSLFDVDELDTSKGTCANPKGTSVTASGAYMSTPEMSVDGSLSTVWNSGGYTGSMRLSFAAAVAIDRVRVAANALPASDETYTITGFLAGASTPLGSFVRSIGGSTEWATPIELPSGTYDALLIEIGGSASWITLAEVIAYDSKSGCALP